MLPDVIPVFTRLHLKRLHNHSQSEYELASQDGPKKSGFLTMQETQILARVFGIQKENWG